MIESRFGLDRLQFVGGAQEDEIGHGQDGGGAVGMEPADAVAPHMHELMHQGSGGVQASGRAEGVYIDDEPARIAGLFGRCGRRRRSAARGRRAWRKTGRALGGGEPAHDGADILTGFPRVGLGGPVFDERAAARDRVEGHQRAIEPQARQGVQALFRRRPGGITVDGPGIGGRRGFEDPKLRFAHAPGTGLLLDVVAGLAEKSGGRRLSAVCRERQQSENKSPPGRHRSFYDSAESSCSRGPRRAVPMVAMSERQRLKGKAW